MELEGTRILILSESFGMGHTMVARAIKEQIESDSSTAIVQIVETTQYLRPTLAKALSNAYLMAIQRSPALWSYFYNRSRHRIVKPQLWAILHRLVYGQVMDLLVATEPDEIICTHPFPSAIVSRLKYCGYVKARLTTVITDYGLHGAWLSPQVDRYLLPSVQLKYQLMEMGLCEERLVVTGIPVHSKFLKRGDKNEARRKLGLSDLPTILCMGGGLGVGLPSWLVQSLPKCLDVAQIIYVTGNNRSLYRELSETPQLRHPGFHLFNFVDNIDELMDAADFIITKPGGVTCSEAIAKRLPALLTRPLPGQEEDNLQYMVDHGYGVVLTNLEGLSSCASLFAQQIQQQPQE